MDFGMYNSSFKPPQGPRRRSPSPPRSFVEPLSPAKPAPIEPLWNYQAIDGQVGYNYPATYPHIGYNARPEAAFIATPKARTYSTATTNGHRRVSSATIDTLAEAAVASLASNSPYQSKPPRKRSVAFETNGYSHAHPSQHHHGASEPPHKRARSELLPSPLVGQYASRPATSYEPNAWSHPGQAGHAYTSRVEEAALLLNFQSGGWPGSTPHLPLPAPPAQRPHANSFPQDVFHMRPAEATMQPHAALLPPFNPQDAQQPPPILPSPDQTMVEHVEAPKAQNDKVTGDPEMTIESSAPRPDVEEQSQQTDDSPEDCGSRATSVEASVVDASLGEVSETRKGRRGWPKGKPRSAGSRKTMAEKAATKRAASHKKTPDRKTARSKSEGPQGDASERREARRKSMNDALAFGEQQHELQPSTSHLRARSVPTETPMTIRDVSPSKAARRKPVVNSDTVCAGCQTSRESAKSHGELDEWISCNGCKKWFHIDCAGFKKAHEVKDVDKYFCTACEPEHGKTTFVRKSTRAHALVDYAELQRGVLKTSEESVEHHYIQPIKDGTFQFDPETFPRMRPELVTREVLEKSGTFVEPICVPAEWNPRPWARSMHKSEDTDTIEPRCDADPMAGLLPDEFEYDGVPDNGQDKLEMVMPQGLTVRQVCNLVGADMPIDVIDVKTQNSGAKWNMSRWADYYESETDAKEIRNVISLEVSQTKLGRLLQRPKVVRDIDLQDDVWPQEEIDKGKLPKVQFYCLMSVADSYTDFHIDFGGSSVYYHILRGKKTFFFIPPKSKHLKAYEEWNDSPQQNYTFLPSITKECYRVDLSEGDTMLIPSGWIHAVWTPEDSLVIGGNFLNRMSYKNQFKVVDIEKANETPLKFRYPHFQKVMWYTAIKYLKTDPLPPEVSEMFYEGKQYEREFPVWADFDGDIAANDPRPGAHNTRFYCQAEIEGLPDLVNFIFRTVMLVLGRIEGISADRMKRVNASIPKGYGEPLEVAKTFALWVAWKRGNEDPPTWAHPDAVLPNSKEEGAPKKLSERKLKELERREAIAAWKVAGPDRQSARVMTKTQTLVKDLAAITATMDGTSSPRQQDHQSPSPFNPNEVHAQSQAELLHAPPAAFVMSSISGQYVSTPKTSVLGPKRIACDACRKRRIKCKHKDMVLQVPSPNGGSNSGQVAFQSNLAPELHDNITVTPSKMREGVGSMGTVMDGMGGQAYAGMNGDGTSQQGPLPGTNAYVNANIPMTMNGVPIFGEVQKRGRTKACYECRKSKRRCIHDDVGNVDPAKAAEPPIPRGSVPSKKRLSTDDGSLLLVKKKQRPSDGEPTYHPAPQHPQMQGHGVLKPVLQGPDYQPKMTGSSNAQHRQQQRPPPPPRLPDRQEPEQPPIDPNLFSMYTEATENGGWRDEQSYPYPTTEQAQPYNPSQPSYTIPSLEQIANEVLVDMNGNEYEHSQQNNLMEHVHVFDDEPDTAPMTNGHSHSKPDDSHESVDSGVSLPTTEALNKDVRSRSPAAEAPADTNTSNDVAEEPVYVHEETAPARPSIEGNSDNAGPTSPLTTEFQPLHPDPATKNSVSSLPLYQPPAPVSQSPDAVRRPNGVAKAHSPVVESKRKRESSASVTPSKKARQASREPEQVVDQKTLELARMLQQEDLGLRRRSK